MLPSPSLPMVGSERPSTAVAVLTSVLLPESPYSAASGSSPIPTPSRTAIMTRSTFMMLCSGMSRLVDLAKALHIDVCIDLHGSDSGVSQHLLYGAQVRAPAEQVCREGMAEGVRRHPLGDPGPLGVPLCKSPDFLARNPDAKAA